MYTVQCTISQKIIPPRNCVRLRGTNFFLKVLSEELGKINEFLSMRYQKKKNLPFDVQTPPHSEIFTVYTL